MILFFFFLFPIHIAYRAGNLLFYLPEGVSPAFLRLRNCTIYDIHSSVLFIFQLEKEIDY